MENKTYDYGCVMLTLPIKQEIWNNIQSMIDEKDIYHDGDLGLESEPHVTALYGIHESVPDSDVVKLIKTFSKKTVNLLVIDCFENEEYDVLIFKLKDKCLFEMNDKLKTLPHTNNYPDYNPHCTIAYLKKGTARKYTGNLDVIYKVKSNIISYSKPNGEIYYYKIG